MHDTNASPAASDGPLHSTPSSSEPIDEQTPSTFHLVHVERPKLIGISIEKRSKRSIYTGLQGAQRSAMHAIVKARDQRALHQQQKELRLATAMAGNGSEDSLSSASSPIDGQPHIYIDEAGISHNTMERVVKGKCVCFATTPTHQFC